MLGRAALICLLAAAPTVLRAQDTAQPEAQSQTRIEIQSPVLVIDQDRLFAETRLGTRTLDALEAKAQELASENQRIEAELIARERELTELRPKTPAEDFKATFN